MDVRTVLASVEEREKWSRRLERLEAALAEVQLKRRRLERRLRTVRRQIAHIADLTEGAIDPSRRMPLLLMHAAQATIPRR
jgi:predicted  nucleic acid-binding Zn-ribbon protein